MKRLCYFAAALLAVSFASRAVAQIANGGFELPTVDAGSSVGNWFRFAGSDGSPGSGGISSDSTAMPRSGLGNIDLETLAGNSFAGIFQTLTVPVLPGYQVAFTGWHKLVSPGPYAAQSEIKLEWQGPNTPDDVITTIVPTSDYTKFTHTGTAPAGTTGLVVTYAVASFVPGGGAAEVYGDDFAVTVIPEPATAGMLGLGLLGLARIRRRK